MCGPPHSPHICAGVHFDVIVLIFLFCFSACSILTGFDVDGRPIIYMRPGRENTETSPRQLRHLVYVLCVIPGPQQNNFN